MGSQVPMATIRRTAGEIGQACSRIMVGGLAGMARTPIRQPRDAPTGLDHRVPGAGQGTRQLCAGAVTRCRQGLLPVAVSDIISAFAPDKAGGPGRVGAGTKIMKCVDDFRFRLGNRELVPIVIGGMGVDISTAELALEAARLGGIGHISDAMVPTVSDRRFKTRYVKDKLKFYKYNVANADKSDVRFDLGHLAEATRLHVGRTMEEKRGDGMVFINCMEKLTMNAPRETLRVRLSAALDAGVDGITLAAGLHLGSFGLMEDHPRFRHAYLGIIVSSLRALQVFLRKNARLDRLPDYVVVEGPLAGGHLGFGMDWARYDLAAIVTEIREWLSS